MSTAFFRRALRNIAFAFPLAGLALPLAGAALAQAQAAGGKMPAAERAGAQKKPAKAKPAAPQAALEIITPWARETMPGAKVGAGYFEVKNNGDKAARLVAVRSEAAQKVEIHSMTMEGNVMKMRRLPDGIEIPPHSGLSFKPGSYHLMFINPKMPFKAGQSFKARFVFAGGAEIEAPFAVRAAGKGGKPAHQMQMKTRGAH